MSTACTRLIPIIVLVLTVGSTAWCGAGNKETTIQDLRARFPRLDDRENLFEVSNEFVLQPGFDTNGELTQIRVVPKYSFENTHPEWHEPDSPTSIPVKKYRNLLARIQSIKAFGNLVRRGKIGITLNLQTSFWDEYTEGIVERTMIRESPQQSFSVTRFAVHYLHPVSGTVDAKEVALFGRRVKIDGKWFWTPASVFKTLAVGGHASIRAAGSLSEEPEGVLSSEPPTSTTH